MSIVIVGPRDRRKTLPEELLVNTTSHAGDEWSSGLSPFKLGPCALYGGRESKVMENAWQFSKVFAGPHVDAQGKVTEAYWAWASAGWGSSRPVRYPMGKGAKPLFLLWDEGERLGYVQARLKVYWQLYRDAVRESLAFRTLRSLHKSGQPLVLFDFDGYNHEAAGVTLTEVLQDESRPMGHAFVLKCMLLFGEDVRPHQVIESGY